MQEHEVSEPEDREEPAAPAGDETLDGFEADLDDVAAALDALDADDLDTAEGLVAGLGDDATPDPAPDEPEPDREG